MMEETSSQLPENTQHLLHLLGKVTEEFKVSDPLFNFNHLLNTYVHLIHDQFGYYAVGLHLTEDIDDEWGEDERRFRLRATTGERGSLLIENAYSYQIGWANSLADWVLQHRQAHIALDVGEEAVYFRNPNFPDTRSEIALPLITQEQLVGVLEIKSTKEAAFSSEDIPLLQSLADQLANIIQDVGAFQKQRKKLVSSE
ncbi:MAG: GAF domain-containing protein [Anaerolineae bacterium]